MKSITISPLTTDRSDYSLSLYFKDIYKIPLLTKEEEVELSEKIKNGDDNALNKLIVSNLKFVVSVAKKYQGKGLPLVDLIQAGNIGLYKAAKAFDGTKGFKFISFAVWYIRQDVMKALSDHARTVRPSFKQIVNASKSNKEIEEFIKENEREPTSGELDVETAEYSIPLEGENGVIDFIENNTDDPEENIKREERTLRLLGVLSHLSPREHDIVCLSYGVGADKMSTDAIAELFDLSTVRTKQILKDAINKLKERYSNNLRELWT